MARLARKKDAPVIAKLWNDARPVMEKTMPPFVPMTVWNEQKVLNRLSHDWQQMYFEPPDLGFFLCQNAAIPAGPYKGQVCSELSIWVVKVGLPGAEQAEVLRSLFRAWFTAERGHRCWGLVPESQDSLSKNFCETVGVGTWGWERFDCERVGLGPWRLYVPNVPPDWTDVA